MSFLSKTVICHGNKSMTWTKTVFDCFADMGHPVKHRLDLLNTLLRIIAVSVYHL